MCKKEEISVCDTNVCNSICDFVKCTKRKALYFSLFFTYFSILNYIIKIFYFYNLYVKI